MTRTFRDIADVRAHLDGEAKRARREQLKYDDILHDLEAGMTDSDIGRRYGVRGVTKTTARMTAAKAGARAFAYEDAVEAIDERR